jgi:TolA-binding protein
MKKLILLTSFLILSWNTFSQTATTQTTTEVRTEVVTDTTQVCLPTPIARQVAKDLIRLDGCKEEIKLLESKIDKMQDISKVKDIMLEMHEEKDTNNEYIIHQLELQVGQYEKLSDDLHKELKHQRTKSFLWKVGTFLGVVTSSYLLIK